MSAPAEPAADWRASRSKRLQARLIPRLVAPIAAALGATYRYRIEGLEPLDAMLRSGDPPPIMVFWHGRILPATLYFRHRGIVVVTSANFDGEWIAGVIGRFGYGAARGSSSRGGARALVELRRAMAKGHAAGFTLDGPRGPARVAQPGAVFLSQLFAVQAFDASRWNGTSGEPVICDRKTAPGWATRAGPRGPSSVNPAAWPWAIARRSSTSARAPPRDDDPRAAP